MKYTQVVTVQGEETLRVEHSENGIQTWVADLFNHVHAQAIVLRYKDGIETTWTREEDNA